MCKTVKYLVLILVVVLNFVSAQAFVRGQRYVDPDMGVHVYRNGRVTINEAVFKEWGDVPYLRCEWSERSWKNIRGQRLIIENKAVWVFETHKDLRIGTPVRFCFEIDLEDVYIPHLLETRKDFQHNDFYFRPPDEKYYIIDNHIQGRNFIGRVEELSSLAPPNS